MLVLRLFCVDKKHFKCFHFTHCEVENASNSGQGLHLFGRWTLPLKFHRKKLMQKQACTHMLLKMLLLKFFHFYFFNNIKTATLCKKLINRSVTVMYFKNSAVTCTFQVPSCVGSGLFKAFSEHTLHRLGITQDSHSVSASPG